MQTGGRISHPSDIYMKYIFDPENFCECFGINDLRIYGTSIFYPISPTENSGKYWCAIYAQIIYAKKSAKIFPLLHDLVSLLIYILGSQKCGNVRLYFLSTQSLKGRFLDFLKKLQKIPVHFHVLDISSLWMFEFCWRWIFKENTWKGLAKSRFLDLTGQMILRVRILSHPKSNTIQGFVRPFGKLWEKCHFGFTISTFRNDILTKTWSQNILLPFSKIEPLQETVSWYGICVEDRNAPF